MSFSSDADSFVDELNLELAENLGIVSRYVLRQVVAKSPVDTGAYRKSHRIEEEEEAAIILTDSPYAVPLEDGHSQQAPQGVYGLAATSARSKFGL